MSIELDCTKLPQEIQQKILYYTIFYYSLGNCSTFYPETDKFNFDNGYNFPTYVFWRNFCPKVYHKVVSEDTCYWGGV